MTETFEHSSGQRDVEALRGLIFGRATCRAYLPQPVAHDVIRSIVDVARGTASWCNVQPWNLVITSGDSTEAFRAALAEHVRQHPRVDSDIPFPAEYRGVHLERRRKAGFQLYEALGIGRGDHEARENQSFQNFRLFGAPHVAIVTIPEELGTYGAVDAGGFICAFLLAAQAHGVSTTPQAALAMQSRFIRRHFDIPDERRMVCGISFGYADPAHPANGYRTGRAAVDDIARFA
ncbi:nitroreductase [Variovorax sp. KK3]|uniref:nitroreductase n=1 Tax=Variovorax sp. KK3 TaxID=1855728 RepID=UPI00097BCA7D|nr:nitroreductase [Variovorax sp. KK3]